MKKNTIIYWVTTLVIVAVMFLGGIMDVVQLEGFAENVKALGYPLYFFVILGIFKIIGSLLLILPKIPIKLKELAYTGFFFDLVYAAISNGVVMEYVKIAPPLVFLGILYISYSYKNKLT